MVDSMVNVLLETLRDVLVEEVKFLSGVSDEVKKVERDLRTIHGLLMDADRKRSDSRALRDCISDLKELAMEAENVLETYDVEVKSKREGKSLKEKLKRLIGILCECVAVHQAGNKIDDIRSRLAGLTTNLQSLSGGGASSNQEQQRLLRLRYAHEIEQHFVGMEKDIEHLVSMVKDESRSVVSICGMGGLGKTTLARKIYHHEDIVRGCFDGRAWVCATQQFQAEAILRDIFKQVDSKRDGIEAMVYPHELVRELHNVLEQIKCLIVIDDIWEANHWDTLKVAFPANCKVVLTTRNEKITCQECDVYKLDFLSEDEGWELLGKIAFHELGTDGPVLESKRKPFDYIGRQIVQKCGRLPLAISVTGGILRQKQHILSEWEKVSSHIDSYLKRGEGMQNDKRVELVLDLSYDALPYYLKPCFLYLACFPEDEKIETQTLYRVWIAEGLVSSEEKGNNDSLNDVAERYLTELANRCMVQVEKHKDDFTHDKFTLCRLHDLMRDLCSTKADEEKFIKCVDISKHRLDTPLSMGSSIHRLAINVDGNAATSRPFKSCMQELEDWRSVLVRCKNFDSSGSIKIDNIVNFERSKHLRILVLENLMFEGRKLPSTIGRLILLRYLSLSGCNVDELPQHVCELPYMHTLNLCVRYDCTIKLPNLIWKMKRLRHLFLPEEIQVIGGDKLRLDGLNELETLDEINSKTVCIVDITKLMNLRKLVATIEQDMDSLSKIVEYTSNNRCQLHSSILSINDCDLSGEEGRNIVKKMLKSHSLWTLRIHNCEMKGSFPSYEQGMCHNLMILAINDSNFGGDVYVVEQMGKYPVLKYLRLSGDQEEVTEAEMRFGANSFPELNNLSISGLLNIKKWEVEKGALPKLEELNIFNCFRNLEKLPDGLRFIPTLRVMSCFDMSEELQGRMLRGGENGESAGLDYAKFSHIPDLYIE